MTSQVSKDPTPILARNIKRAREDKGFTQRRLASQVNDVDPLAVSRWERGIAAPNRVNLMALSEALDRDIAWFYTDHDEEPVAA